MSAFVHAGPDSGGADMVGATSGDYENVSARLPKTEMEAACLRPAIADLLQSIPATWAEFDIDKLTQLQDNALFLLTAAGMVERRGWIRTTIANHPTCFELRFQSTGEGGFKRVMEHATAIEYETWRDAWRKWSEGETRDRSPFHIQEMKPQEWRLTDQGENARDELNRAKSDADRLIVLDFVRKKVFAELVVEEFRRKYPQYAAIYRDHPFLQPSDQVNWLRRLLENQEVLAALRLN